MIKELHHQGQEKQVQVQRRTWTTGGDRRHHHLLPASLAPPHRSLPLFVRISISHILCVLWMDWSLVQGIVLLGQDQPPDEEHRDLNKEGWILKMSLIQELCFHPGL